MTPSVFGFLCLGSAQFFGFALLPATGRPLETYSPGRVFAVSGQDVVLPCRLPLSVAVSRDSLVEWKRIEGPSVVTVHVERSGEELVKEKDAAYVGRTKLLEDGSLSLLGVSRRDIGTYMCAFPTETWPQVSVSLVVGEVSEISVSFQRMPVNQMLVRCECSSWNLELLMSVLDGGRKAIPAQIQSSVGPDGNYSISSEAHLTVGKGQKVVICRVEEPGGSIVKEEKVYIPGKTCPHAVFRCWGTTCSFSISSCFLGRVGLSSLGCFIVFAEELDHPDVGLRWSTLLLSTVLVFVLTAAVAVVVVVAVLPVPVIQNLRSSLQNLVALPFRRQVGLFLAEYGDIHKVDTTGSLQQLNVNGQRLTGHSASNELARRDLKELERHTENILSVANKLRVHPALIAAIISRQSKFGEMLLPSGFGISDPNCFGLMQINKNYHAVKGNPYSEEHMDQGVTFLIQLFKSMTRNKLDWNKEQRLKGALACYIAGEERVLPLLYEQLDTVTPGGDFANDVIARAQFFSQQVLRFRNT
ncbi:uncharacterized protein LOC113139482 isoform X1 [Mastacembelus armatus]|uniref:uncharacterized protein LOC113139482 isoform X1 n=1 Tax=Mastacembelus armatus TaxID=205130 RepID=UPI000E45FDFE|nr:uncharacterized protein LOC113139482 isoform X1 [Mastacembelus armatus]